MQPEIERAIEALRIAIAKAIEDARARERQEAARALVAQMNTALGIEPPKRRGRKPKA